MMAVAIRGILVYDRKRSEENKGEHSAFNVFMLSDDVFFLLLLFTCDCFILLLVLLVFRWPKFDPNINRGIFNKLLIVIGYDLRKKKGGDQHNTII